MIKTVNKNPFWGPESAIYTMLFGTWLMIRTISLFGEAGLGVATC